MISSYLSDHLITSQEKMIQSVETMMDQINMFAVRMLTDSRIYTIMQSDLPYASKNFQFNQYLDSFVTYKDIIGGISVLTHQGEHYHYSDSIMGQLDQSYIDRIGLSNTPVWGATTKDQNNEAYSLVGRKYRNFYTGQSIGYLIIYIRENTISNIINQDIYVEKETFCIDQDGTVVSHPDKSVVGSVPMFSAMFEYQPQRLTREINLNGEPVIIGTAQFSHRLQALGLNWQIVSIIPANDYFRPIYQLRDILLILGAIVLIVIVFVTYVVSYKLSQSITRLNDNINDFAYKNESIIINNDPKDELWELENSFTEMIGRIHELIDRNNEEKEKQRELELIALQAQINPHFIYNTLDAIAWTAKIGKQKSIEEMVMALARFLRLSLHQGDKFITIDEELQLIQNYIDIELMRFPEKFTVDYSFEPLIGDHLILKLSLQPIVENAIKHGISEKEGVGHIRISGRRERDLIIISILDNGIGFNDKDITIRSSSHSISSGYGLKNVNERIKLEYGNDYGLFVESEIDKGTKVDVIIPWNLT